MFFYHLHEPNLQMGLLYGKSNRMSLKLSAFVNLAVNVPLVFNFCRLRMNPCLELCQCAKRTLTLI